MNCPTDEVLALYVDKLVENDLQLETHIDSCPTCRETVRELQYLTQALREEGLPPPDEKLVQDILAATQTSRRKRSLWFYSPLLIVAALLLFVFIPVMQNQDDSEFGERGAVQGDPDQWVRLDVMQAPSQQILEPVAPTLRPDAALAFAYSRRPDSPYRYLLVLGRSDRGDLFWYYPSFTDASSNPCSLSLGVGKSEQLLPDRIQHELPIGGYTIYAVFSQRPYCVQEIENILNQKLIPGQDAPSRLPLPDTAQHAKRFEVKAGE